MHRDFLDRALARVAADGRFEALLGAGSMIHGGFDLYSDLDFVAVVRSTAYEAMLAERLAFAEGFGDLLSAFTGEHVGEPRLLICLYGPPLLHVDFKFVRQADLVTMIERPLLLWAADRARTEALLNEADVAWPDADPQWFEDRVWVWLHYGATKINRGEVFEALGMLAFLRERVLGPMLMRREGHNQRGVRRIETWPQAAAPLQTVCAAADATDIKRALRAAADLYLELRADQPPKRTVAAMPQALFDFVG